MPVVSLSTKHFNVGSSGNANAATSYGSAPVSNPGVSTRNAVVTAATTGQATLPTVSTVNGGYGLSTYGTSLYGA